MEPEIAASQRILPSDNGTPSIVRSGSLAGLAWATPPHGNFLRQLQPAVLGINGWTSTAKKDAMKMPAAR